AGHRRMSCSLPAAATAPSRPLDRLLARRTRAGRRSMSAAAGTAPLLEVEGLKKHFPIRQGLLSRVSGYVYAVDGVSFHIERGESLGLVGESGCGKWTVGRTLLKLVASTAGWMTIHGTDITESGSEQTLA